MRLDVLVPAARNPKGHDASIASMIERFGYTSPVELDERTGRMVAGHGRLEKLLERKGEGGDVPRGILVDVDGEWKVPVLRGWASADDAEAEEYLLGHNRSGELGGWVFPELVEMLEDLNRGQGRNLDLIGFPASDLDVMFAQLEKQRAEQNGDGDTPPVDDAIRPPTNPVTKLGDVWLLGDHRLICGDCRDVEVIMRLTDGRQVNLAFTSPPYAEQRDYDEGSGFVPIPPDEYVGWFAAVAGAVEHVLAADGSWFVNIKPPGHELDTHLYVFDLVLAHVRAWGWHFVTEFCWERGGVPKRVAWRFKNQFEPIYHFARGPFKIRPLQVRHLSDNAIAPMEPGAAVGIDTRLRSGQGGTGASPIAPRTVDANGGPMGKMQGEPGGPNVGKRTRKGGSVKSLPSVQGTNWSPGEALEVGFAYPGNRLPTFSGSHEATGHSAAFPVGLPGWFVRAFTDPGDVVLDPFGGSGSTLLAAHEEGRIGLTCELSPKYCDVILERYQRRTGDAPTLERTGKRFKARARKA